MSSAKHEHKMPGQVIGDWDIVVNWKEVRKALHLRDLHWPLKNKKIKTKNLVDNMNNWNV